MCSVAKIRAAWPICFRLFNAAMRVPLALALANAGSNMAARTAATATTTSAVMAPCQPRRIAEIMSVAITLKMTRANMNPFVFSHSSR